MISKLATAAVLVTALAPLLPAQDEAALLATLKDQTSTLEQKQHACQRLAAIGTAKAVPTLAGMLSDPGLAHSARYALESIPDPAVDTALRESLPNLEGKELIGAINSIGVRRDTEAVPALAALLREPETATAAARALGSMGSLEAGEVLKVRLPDASPEQLPALGDALIAVAKKLVADKKTVEALALTQALLASPDTPNPIRVAAWRSEILSKNAFAPAVLTHTLLNGDDELFSAAIQASMEFEHHNATATLTEALDKLPADRQVRLIGAIAERGDQSASAALLHHLTSGPDPARIAAARALTRLAHPPAIPVLATLSKQADRALTTAARDCLANFPHPDADIAIAILLADDDPTVRILATKLAAPRDPAVVIPVLIATATDRNEAVALAALATLRDLAGLTELRDLVQRLLDARSPAIIQATSHAIVALCSRQPQVDGTPPAACIDPLVEALPNAKGPAKSALVKILRRLGGPQAEAAIRATTTG